MRKARVFIASSSEALKIARAVQAHLQKSTDCDVWEDNVFVPGMAGIENLVKAAHDSGFAVIVLTSDDFAVVRGQKMQLPRDNVLFELGLFMGTLGRDRAFILQPEMGAPHTASDLLGVTVLLFQTPSGSEGLKSALGPPCEEIRQRIETLGLNGPSVFKDAHVTNEMKELCKNIAAGLSVDHYAFTQEVRERLHRLQEDCRSWRDARLRTGADTDYWRCLVGIYREARSTVFSTSVPEYFKLWDQAHGQAVLDAQSWNHNARSTRVFIFRSRLDIDAEAKRILNMHLDHRVTVRLYFSEEKTTPTFPEEMEPDWTLVDDAFVGITKKFGNDIAAEWLFQDESLAQRFRDLRDALLDASVEFERGEE